MLEIKGFNIDLFGSFTIEFAEIFFNQQMIGIDSILKGEDS